MPQMSPIWWSTLFIMFMITFMITMMLMYFFINYKLNYIKKLSQEKMKINWKW